MSFAGFHAGRATGRRSQTEGARSDKMGSLGNARLMPLCSVDENHPLSRDGCFHTPIWKLLDGTQGWS